MFETILTRTIFYVSIAVVMLIFWSYLKKTKPTVNLGFLVFLFLYRIPLIPIYIKYIPGDWIGYIYHLLSGEELIFQLGSGAAGVVWFGSIFRVFNLDTFDYFFLYSLFGYFGTVIFYLIIHEFTQHTDRVTIGKLNIFPWVLLYPSLHMYTVMLGKDPIIYFGIALATYGLMGKSISWLKVLIGIFFMVLVRPHMAVVFIGALFIALLLSNEWNRIKKGLLFLSGGVAAIIIVPQLLSLFRISGLNLEAIQMAIELNEGYVSDAGTYVNMSSYPLALKIFTYLFRPLFIDSPNALLLEYSLENLLFLCFFVLSLRLFFFKWLSRQPLVLKFSFIYFILGVLVLSNGLSVFGLFIRQKTMIFLNFLTVLLAFWYYTKEIKNRVEVE